jgi:hypothetical protein
MDAPFDSGDIERSRNVLGDVEFKRSPSAFEHLASLEAKAWSPKFRFS